MPRTFLGRRAWSPAEEERLRRLAPRKTAAEIARLMGRTTVAVTARASLLRIPLQKRGEAHPGQLYSDDAVREILRRYYRDGQTIRSIGAELGIPWGSVSMFTSGRQRRHLYQEYVAP